MSDTTDLPPIHQAILDHAMLAQLAVDIQTCAELIDISTKGGPEQRAQETPLTANDLNDLFALLESGHLRGLQMRYIFESAQWWDTLIHSPDGVRLTRIQHTFEP